MLPVYCRSSNPKRPLSWRRYAVLRGPCPQPHHFRISKFCTHFVQFCTTELEFCTPSPSPVFAVQIWGAGSTYSPTIFEFQNKNCVIILYTFRTILYTLPFFSIRNSIYGWRHIALSSANFEKKKRCHNFVHIWYNRAWILYSLPFSSIRLIQLYRIEKHSTRYKIFIKMKKMKDMV